MLWASDSGDSPLSAAMAAFGENISIHRHACDWDCRDVVCNVSTECRHIHYYRAYLACLLPLPKAKNQHTPNFFFAKRKKIENNVQNCIVRMSLN